MNRKKDKAETAPENARIRDKVKLNPDDEAVERLREEEEANKIEETEEEDPELIGKTWDIN